MGRVALVVALAASMAFVPSAVSRLSETPRQVSLDERANALARANAPTSVIWLLPRYSSVSDVLLATASASFVAPTSVI